MRIAMDEKSGKCTLNFERRDKNREQLIPIRGLYNALYVSFGGDGDKTIRMMNTYLRENKTKDIIQKVDEINAQEDKAIDEFKSLSDEIKKVVIRRLYAVVACYCDDFTY